MLVYLLRHGETDWNKEKRIQGCTDIPINEYGRELARKTRDGLKDTKFDMCLCSPLCRARETASIVLEGRDVPIEPCDAVREMNFGEYEGLPSSEEPMKTIWHNFFHDTESYVASKTGESVEELLARAGEFLAHLSSNPDYQDKRILVSTHGAAMTAMINQIKGETGVAKFWQMGVPKNCAVTCVEYSDGKWRILEENRVFYE